MCKCIRKCMPSWNNFPLTYDSECYFYNRFTPLLMEIYWGRNLHSRRQWSKLKGGIAMCKLNLMNSAVIIWTQSSQVLFSENRCTWKSSPESLDCEWLLLLRQLRLRMTYFTIKLLQWNTINFPFTIPKFTTGCASGKVSETDNKSF